MENAHSCFELVTYPDKRLFSVATPYIGSFSILPIVIGHDMIFLMKRYMGKGLAAQQAGVKFQIFVMQTELGEELICVNPEIISMGGPVTNDVEGCLSFPVEPRKCPKIERFSEVELSFTDQHGNPQRRKFTGIDAVCVQHEMDHLKGITIMQRISSSVKRERFRKSVRAKNFSYDTARLVNKDRSEKV